MKKLGSIALAFLLPLVGMADTPVGIPVVYKTVDGRELKLHILSPLGGNANDKRPAIVIYHGGGFIKGEPANFNKQAEYLAKLGMVAVLVEYRLLKYEPTMGFPIVCIHDARSAMRWVRSHAGEWGIDPNRIVVAGGSAGGYLAMSVAMMDDSVPLSGILDDPLDDLSVSVKASAMVLFNPPLDMKYKIYELLATPIQFLRWDTYAERKLGKMLSPIENIRIGAPPAIMFYGSLDKFVTRSKMRLFRSRMSTTGTRCDLLIYQGQLHGFFNYKEDSPNNNKYYFATMRRTKDFLSSLGLL